MARLFRLSECRRLYAGGYRCIEQARSRSAQNALTTTTNHSGVCLFYRTRYTVRRLKLPSYKSMELLTVHVTGAAVNFMLVVVYRPGLQTATSVFFDDFADLVERMAAHSAPIVIIGDINLHLDDQSASSTINFRAS